jgi:hypothetical protein
MWDVYPKKRFFHHENSRLFPHIPHPVIAPAVTGPRAPGFLPESIIPLK